MSSLEQILKEIEARTDRIANREFKQGSTALTDGLISRKRHYVRDANENENTLASLSMGEPIADVFDLRDQSKPFTEEDIMPALRAAAKMNEICQNKEIEEKISNLLSVYDDTRLNIDNLKDQIAKGNAEIDMLTVRNTELNTMNTMEYEDDFTNEEAEIERLEAALREKRAINRRLAKQKVDLLRVGEDLKNRALTRSSNKRSPQEAEALREEVEQLENQATELRQRIADYDAQLESSEAEKSVEDTPATTDELFIGLCAHMEDLLKDSVTQDAADSNEDHLISVTQDAADSNEDNLISMLKEIEIELKEVITKIETVEADENKIIEAKSIYYQILTFVNQRVMHPDQPYGNDIDFEKFNEAFPHHPKTTVPEVPLAREALEMTCILLKLYTDGDMPLFDLTNYIENLTKDRGVSMSQINMAIYKLSANNLVFIDRSHKDTLVKLKLHMI